MQPKKPSSNPRRPRRVLVIDVGGSHVKFQIGGRGKIGKFTSGPRMSAAQMVKRVEPLVPRESYDAVSIGYPGLVVDGRIAADPYNLGPGWMRFDFERAFGAPVRLINDAAMQAIGSYTGGRMLFLGLGTGLGATFISDGRVEPMEIGHMPFKHRSYEDYVGERGRLQLGNKKWRKIVREVVDNLTRALQADYAVVGGGNVKRLELLAKRERRGDNRNAFKGGIRLWQTEGYPLTIRAAKTSGRAGGSAARAGGASRRGRRRSG